MKSYSINRLISVVFFVFVSFSLSALTHTLPIQTSGNISVFGPDYVDNMTETYYVNTGVNKPIIFDFSLDVETDCDGVDIYSIDIAGNVSDSPVASYTGNIPHTFTSSYIASGRAMVVFYSDGSVCNDYGLTGLEMTYSVDNSFVVSNDINILGNAFINGNLGIGYNNPLEKLHINGSVRGNLTSGALRVKTDYGSLDIGALNDTGTHIYTDLARFYFNKQIQLITGELTSYSSTNLSLQTNSITRITVLNSSGNVGIGTTTPQANLDIRGANKPIGVSATQTGNLRIATSDAMGINIGGSLVLGGKYQTANEAIIAYGTIHGKKETAVSGNNYGYLAFETADNSVAPYSRERMRINGIGNVGIGTSDPKNKLDVIGKSVFGSNAMNRGSYNNGLSIQNNTGEVTSLFLWENGVGSAHLGFKENNNTLYLVNSTTDGSISNSSSIALKTNGNVGIGNTDPANKLDVVGSSTTTLEAAGFYNTTAYIKADKAETRINIGKIAGTTRQPMGAIGAFPSSNDDSSSGNLSFYTRKSQNMIERVKINQDGNVSIGNSTTTPTDELLTVFGVIHAKEIKVDLTESLADFVFHPTYSLMPLHEVEQFVKINSHLPEIPSAAEVSKNGMSIGEMQNKLLQKIEELTLYVIELKKTNEIQNTKIEQLEKK